MCAASPLLFQHPGPVGCSPAALHLCSEESRSVGDRMERRWPRSTRRGGRREREEGREGETVGQGRPTDRPTGGVGTAAGPQNAVSATSDVKQPCFSSLKRPCRRGALPHIVRYTCSVKYRRQEVTTSEPAAAPLLIRSCRVVTRSSFAFGAFPLLYGPVSHNKQLHQTPLKSLHGDVMAPQVKGCN